MEPENGYEAYRRNGEWECDASGWSVVRFRQTDGSFDY